MEKAEYRKVSLATLGNGSAAALFDEALNRVFSDIVDPATDWRQKRKITLEATFSVSEVGSIDVAVTCSTALARPSRKAKLATFGHN